MKAAMLSNDRIALDKIETLIVDDNAQALEILHQVVAGFGCKKLHRAASGEEAKSVLERMSIDLLITDGRMPDTDGYQLIHWLRREAPEKNKFIPAFIVTGHARRQDVYRARDCGAHFTVAKPLTPKILLERIFWAAKEERMMLECDTFIGPDRRFKRMGVPPGMKGRRSDDLSEDIGDATTPNLSDDQLNAMIKPQKVSL